MSAHTIYFCWYWSLPPIRRACLLHPDVVFGATEACEIMGATHDHAHAERKERAEPRVKELEEQDRKRTEFELGLNARLATAQQQLADEQANNSVTVGMLAVSDKQLKEARADAERLAEAADSITRIRARIVEAFPEYNHEMCQIESALASHNDARHAARKERS